MKFLVLAALLDQSAALCEKPVRADGKCGPLFDGSACETATSPYCNEDNGYCGGGSLHEDAQASTAYDY